MTYLPYISDEALRTAVKAVFDCILRTQAEAENAMYRNVIDPFSAIFDGAVQGLTLEEWLLRERARQIQKTVQNQIGLFHQHILGSLPGWQILPQGLDICNNERLIFAEIKNKYNTVKGSDKVGIYDYLLVHLNQPNYQSFTAYYVEIIPPGRNPYNKPFTPSDRTTGTIRPNNENIRQISGQAFYDLATGEPKALSMLFDILPDVISDVSGLDKLSEQQKTSFRSLFDKAY
ncbi:Eco47II family restriction endonuclease [Coleofasciculus sp. FACHB-SPT36]|uniref:Eco47II family restriction endonuclease n=1 Tax=Cyanophyceae TaxID=3028117 RepID=UPI00168B6B82|nr:Eco47II family restriction endonuclease [Coleofasciculus sp. FACHB-SPT36]MBD2537563.1 Eco47II family restriction endonuclease [Coleofasciculus sp. FACHB-SPT36]